MLGVLVMEVVLLADNSIKLICPKCFQVARVTSKYTLLMCGRCCCDMVKAPVFSRSGEDGRSCRRRDADVLSTG